jgi:hypothetical protein
MANYQYALFTDVVAALSRRLYDPTNQQWTVAELTAILIESLRTWNALSQFWRQDFTFNLALNTWWYDLRGVSGSLIPCTVAQYDIITKIQNHLLEPPTPAAWSGSSQYSLADILQACQRRQDETLGTTACTIVRSLVNAPLVSRRTVLPDTTIDIRRVAWLPTSGGYTNKILVQSDNWATRAYNSGYAQAGQIPPSKWMQNTEPPPSFDTDSVPPVNGQYDLLTTQGGGAWVQGANATLSTMPTDWSWVFTFGALADLFSRDSLAEDKLRASYCRARYKEGLALMRMMPVLLDFRLNDVPMSVGALTGGDRYNATWQAQAAGPPTSIYTFMNLMAVAPMPDSSVAYGAKATVCRNIDVSQTYVQVPRDDLDTVIDYAQHLAKLKQGGQEFYGTVPLYQNLQRKCAQYNGKLKEMGFFEIPQLELSTLEESARNPRYIKGSGPSADN